jgi:predicted O-methyltransferase YrrM
MWKGSSRAVRGRVASAREQLERHGSPLGVSVARALGRLTTDALQPRERRSLTQIGALAERLQTRDDLISTRFRGPGGLKRVGEVAKASKLPYDGATMFLLARETRPRLCLELGTNVGISASYQASAQQLNGVGRTVTLEGAPGRSSIATEVFAELGLDNVELRVGPLKETLDPTLEELGSFDWAFMDAHHKEKPTLEWFDRISTRVARPGLILVDDIGWSEGMASAWGRISARPDVSLAVALGRIGLCLFE